VRSLAQRAARAQALRDQVASELDTRIKEVDTLAARVDVLAKVGELFRALMDRLVLSQVRSVEAVITEGLKTIFFDQVLSFEAEIVQRYNRVNIDFFIREEHDGGKYVVRGRPLSNFGGGPATISSFVLRLLVLMKLKRWPVLLLDETLSAVSPEYIDQTGLFLKKLAQSTGTPILLVTQQHAFVEQASMAYAASVGVKDGRPRLEINRVRGPA
jgi:hypothetical protein